MIDRLFSLLSSMPAYKAAANIASMLALWVLICGIAINFYLSSKSGRVKKERRSLVATGSMFLFFFIMYALAFLPFGRFAPGRYEPLFCLAGAATIIFGVIFNITGRFYLKANWGNQIKIYTDHTLITRGPYSVTRHPLYASTIWMLIGFGLLQSSWLVILCTLLIFLPMMRYRAGLEEKALEETFGEQYRQYKNNTGMFFPKINRKVH